MTTATKAAAPPSRSPAEVYDVVDGMRLHRLTSTAEAFRQWVHDYLWANALVEGKHVVKGRRVRLGDITVPVLNVLAKFVLGRLAGYLAFGALAGFLGSKLAGFNFELVTMIALAVLSIILILHAVGLWNAKRLSFCALIKRSDPELPFIMGILMGVNACPHSSCRSHTC